MENPGKIELKRILNCMKDYEYDDSLEQGEFDGYYKFNLTKRLDYISDDTIKVTIDFPTVIDTHTYKKNADGVFLYNDVKNSDRARKFINKLMKDDSTKTGGQKKKQRKTKKDKKRNKEKQRKTKKINNYTF
jgi:hypothetical protein